MTVTPEARKLLAEKSAVVTEPVKTLFVDVPAAVGPVSRHLKSRNGMKIVKNENGDQGVLVLLDRHLDGRVKNSLIAQARKVRGDSAPAAMGAVELQVVLDGEPSAIKAASRPGRERAAAKCAHDVAEALRAEDYESARALGRQLVLLPVTRAVLGRVNPSWSQPGWTFGNTITAVGEADERIHELAIASSAQCAVLSTDADFGVRGLPYFDLRTSTVRRVSLTAELLLLHVPRNDMVDFRGVGIARVTRFMQDPSVAEQLEVIDLLLDQLQHLDFAHDDRLGLALGKLAVSAALLLTPKPPRWAGRDLDETLLLSTAFMGEWPELEAWQAENAVALLTLITYDLAPYVTAADAFSSDQLLSGARLIIKALCDKRASESRYINNMESAQGLFYPLLDRFGNCVENGLPTAVVEPGRYSTVEGSEHTPLLYAPRALQAAGEPDARATGAVCKVAARKKAARKRAASKRTRSGKAKRARRTRGGSGGSSSNGGGGGDGGAAAAAAASASGEVAAEAASGEVAAPIVTAEDVDMDDFVHWQQQRAGESDDEYRQRLRNMGTIKTRANTRAMFAPTKELHKLQRGEDGKLRQFHDGQLVPGARCVDYPIMANLDHAAEVGSLTDLARLYLGDDAATRMQAVEAQWRSFNGTAKRDALSNEFAELAAAAAAAGLVHHVKLPLVQELGAAIAAYQCEPTPARARHIVPRTADLLVKEELTIERSAGPTEPDTAEPDDDILAERRAEIETGAAAPGESGQKTSRNGDFVTRNGELKAQKARPNPALFRTIKLESARPSSNDEPREAAGHCAAMVAVQHLQLEQRAHFDEARSICAASMWAALASSNADGGTKTLLPTDTRSEDALARAGDTLISFDSSRAIRIAGGLLSAFGLPATVDTVCVGADELSLAQAEAALGVSAAAPCARINVRNVAVKHAFGDLVLVQSSETSVALARVITAAEGLVTFVRVQQVADARAGVNVRAGLRRVPAARRESAPSARVFALSARIKIRDAQLADRFFKDARERGETLTAAAATRRATVARAELSVQTALNLLLAGVQRRSSLRKRTALKPVSIMPDRDAALPRGKLSTDLHRSNFFGIETLEAVAGAVYVDLGLEQAAQAALSRESPAIRAAAGRARVRLVGNKSPGVEPDAPGAARAARLKTLKRVCRGANALGTEGNARISYGMQVSVERNRIVLELRYVADATTFTRVIPEFRGRTSAPLRAGWGDPNVSGSSTVESSCHIAFITHGLAPLLAQRQRAADDASSMAARLQTAIETVRAAKGCKVFPEAREAADVKLKQINFADADAVARAVATVGSSRAWRWKGSLLRRERKLRRKLANERRAAYNAAARALAADPSFDVLMLPVLRDVARGPRAARQHNAFMASAELDRRIDEALRTTAKARLKVSEYGTTITSLYPVGMLDGLPVHEIARPGAKKVRMSNGSEYHRDIPSNLRSACSRTAADFADFAAATQ